jgi:hypothetical protein
MAIIPISMECSIGDQPAIGLVDRGIEQRRGQDVESPRKSVASVASAVVFVVSVFMA